MRVIVVGCGRVGSGVALRLQREGHDVAIIDKNPGAFRRRIPADWPGQMVVGFGFDRDVLDEAGILEASALAAVTSGDNSNILTARIARETFELPNVVARIYDPRRAVIYQRLGIPTVATVSWTVDQVVRRLLPEDTVTSWTDPTGEASMVEHLLPNVLCGRKLADFADGDRYRPVLVTRGGAARIVDEASVGQEGDVVHFLVRTDALDALERRMYEARGTDRAAQPAGSGRAGGRP